MYEWYVGCQDVSEGQVRKGQVRTGLRTVSNEKSQVGTVRVRVNQVRTCEVKLGQYKSSWYRSGQDWSTGQVRPRQVKDQVKLSQDRSILKREKLGKLPLKEGCHAKFLEGHNHLL